MKVMVSRNELSHAALRSQGAISEKSQANIGLKAEAGRLQLSASDRVLLIYSSLDCEVLEAGAIFVPARLFSDVVKQLPDGPVKLEKEENFLVITAGTEGQFVMKLPRIEDRYWKDPPSLSSENTASLPSDKLLYLIEQVQFCIAHDSTRNYGTVGFLHRPAKESLRLVGSDGYRLSMSELSIEMPDEFLSNGVCLSKRALGEIQRMCGDGFANVELCISDDQTTLLASVPDYQIFARLSAVKYPNYEGVLPSGELTSVRLSRSYFQSVIKRVLLASDKTKALQLCFSDSSLTLRSRTLGSSESHESLSIPDYDGEDRDLAINGKFLMEVFSTLSCEEVDLKFRSEEHPILLTPNDEPVSCVSKHVLVPIREG